MGEAKTMEESRAGEGEEKGEETYKKWRINIIGRS